MPDDDDIAYARELIRHSVWSGLEDDEDRAQIVADLLAEEPGHDAAALRAYAAAEVARKAAEEAHWPEVTDCDRLDAAFAALPAQGILALHDAGYTRADGHVEAAEALADAPPGRFVGWCFYHRQDIEGALEGAALHIAFDHVDGEGSDKLMVGRRVEAELLRAGFAIDWDGTTARRIALPGFRWQRRG